MQLPKDFIDKYTTLLGKEAEAFFSTYEEPKTSGLRVNPLKDSEDASLAELFHLSKVPFCKTGFYYEEHVQPGKHPYHQAGVYYIQEPSAMFVGEVLSPKPGETVLDLCAAPGGKSTHLAGMMNNEGLLISNEIHPVRIKALAENIERLGVTNCVVTNETPEKLAKKFPGFFDKILVDAPCSGEGMFRKDQEAIEFWSLDHVEHCARQQKDILHHAYEMLKEDGILVYSTCTFAPEENEQMIEWLLEQYPDLVVLPIEKEHGISDGRVDWTKHNLEKIQNTARLWPHYVRGEGHFVAKLQKKAATAPWRGKTIKSNVTKQELKDYVQFEKDVLQASMKGTFITFKSQLYAVPEQCPDLDKIKVVRSGLHLGEFKKNRFEPNHALALALAKDEVRHTISLTTDSDEWKKYIRGETLQTGGDNGWSLVTIDGYSLGWGKETKGTLKNFYPKGLRKHVW